MVVDYNGVVEDYENMVIEYEDRVSSKQNKKISVRTKTNRNKICFGCVSVCFMNKEFRFVSACFSVLNLYRNN
jgi:hypothetical protein